MSGWIDQAGGVHVAGIGLHRYLFPSDVPFPVLGLTAVRAALADAGIDWRAVGAAYVGTTSLGMAAGRVMLDHLGATGLEVVQVENASASGSFAFRQAVQAVAAGAHDVVLALGVDKFGRGHRAVDVDGIERVSEAATLPVVHFALMAARYLREHGFGPEAIAAVAVKNHANAARNPYAQMRKLRTLADVLASPPVAGPLTVQQCCPRGDGAAAVLVVSDRYRRRHGLDRTVRVLASIANSETRAQEDEDPLVTMVRTSADAAYAVAGVSPAELDLVELHDAFTVEELVYAEAMGLFAPGEAAIALARGEIAIGGRVAVNASGGLIGMGHPLGPTGIGQVAEIVRQLRGEAGDRQQPDARIGMAHMIGLGSVGVAHILGWGE